jgi:hypothetical protein
LSFHPQKQPLTNDIRIPKTKISWTIQPIPLPTTILRDEPLPVHSNPLLWERTA